MEDLKKTANDVMSNLMKIASSFREEKGEEVQPMIAFLVGNQCELMPREAFPSRDKDQIATWIREIAMARGASCVFTVGEAWVAQRTEEDLNSGPAPSKDPDRKEVIMVTASGLGISLMLMREILGPDKLGEIQSHSDFTGRFSDLSGREMLN